MNERDSGISHAFQAFQAQTPRHAEVWMGTMEGLTAASALDRKTEELAYLAVLAALRLVSGIPFHVRSAKQEGATREEVLSAVLVGLPAAGYGVTQALPAAIEAFDSAEA